MNVCVIDIGSNTIKASIFKIQKNCTNKVLGYKGIKAKLVSFVEEKDGERILSSVGTEILHTSLAELLRFSEEFSCYTIYAFATASLRGICNADSVISQVKDSFGLTIEILSGEEEALCSLRGVLSDYDIGEVKEGIMVDMGGGSTEVVYFANGIDPIIVSLPFGCLSLYNNFVKGSIPTYAEKKSIETYVAKQLQKCKFAENSHVPMYLVGGSGRAVSKLINGNKGKKTLRADGGDFVKVTEMLSDTEFFKKAEEIIPGRTTTVSPASVAYYAIVKYVKPTKVTVTDSGVREGYLEKILP